MEVGFAYVHVQISSHTTNFGPFRNQTKTNFSPLFSFVQVVSGRDNAIFWTKFWYRMRTTLYKYGGCGAGFSKLFQRVAVWFLQFKWYYSVPEKHEVFHTLLFTPNTKRKILLRLRDLSPRPAPFRNLRSEARFVNMVRIVGWRSSSGFTCFASEAS